MRVKRGLTFALCTLALLIGGATAAGAQATFPPPLVVQPALPTTVEQLHITVARPCALINEPVIAGNVITIRAPMLPCPPPPPGFPLPQPTIATFTVGPLAAGTYTVKLFDHLPGGPDFLVATREVVVQSPVKEALLGQGDSRFQVSLRWRDARVGSGDGFAQQLTTDSAYFWFFHPSNIEVTVKILDGRAVNGHFWVFVASMTDVGFDIVVSERTPACMSGSPIPCPARVYSQSPSSNRNFFDVEAF